MFLDQIILTDYLHLLKTKKVDGRNYLFDPIRKNWYLLQPEEFVRQLWIVFLTKNLSFPRNRISVEKEFKVHTIKKRYDLVLYTSTFQPWLLIECKSSQVKIDEKVWLQASHYNVALQVPYLVLSNGSHHVCLHVDYENQKFNQENQLPFWDKE